ncbi:MAG: hypothetical protein WAW07_08365 [Bacteroidales bacterium]
MRKIIFSTLSLLLTVFIFVSCDEKFDDLMTGNVKTGGMINPTTSIPYKLGSTPSFDITLDIPKGPGIGAIEVYRAFYELDENLDPVQVGEVLDQTIDVGSANVADDLSETVTYTYAQLATGLTLPADENLLNIGEFWELRYVSVMEDGRKVDVATKTVVAVANFFAGPYVKSVKYFHPTGGGSYPTTPYSAYEENVDLVAKNAFECDDWFGVWEDNKLTMHIDQSNNYEFTLTFERPDAVAGDPNNPANVCSYDPATGVIKLFYFYPGSGGNRIFWVVYTPR